MARFRYGCALVVAMLAFPYAEITYSQTPSEPLPTLQNAATMTGAPPYSTHEAIREDIALASGDLHVYIPVFSLTGKGGQTFNLGWAADSHSINVQEFDVADGWNDYAGNLYPFVYADWVVSPEILGYVTVPHLRAAWQFQGDYAQGCSTGMNCQNFPLFCNSNFTFRDEYGTSHSFTNDTSYGYALARDCSNTGQTGAQNLHTNPVADSDESHGVKLDTSNPNDIVVWTKDGTAYHFPAVTTWPSGSISSGPEVLVYYDFDFVKIVDRNGNTITNTHNTNGSSTITDSVGRTITVGPANQSVSWTDSNGTPQTFSVTTGGTAGPAVTTHATSCQFTNQYQSQYQTQGYLWNGLDIGNLTNYATAKNLSFPGGATYNVQFDQLGKITKVTYPSGGYSRYDYVDSDPEFHLGALTCYAADYWEVSAKHVCSINSGCTPSQEFTTTYTPVNSPADGANLQTDVVDPLGNRTHYNFNETNNQSGVPRNPRETDRFIYQGQSTLIKTIHTDYTSNESAASDAALPYQVTTTLNDVTPNLVSKVVTTYDSLSESYANIGGTLYIDNPTEIDEYDFDGTVKRKTTYTWEKTGNYSPNTGHILDRPATKTVTDPATNNVSTTVYGYDTVGNLTGVTVGGTNTTSLTTSYQYDSYGDLKLITDPLQNQTSAGYASPWYDTSCAQSADSSGKPSSVTNALSQTTKYQYYSCTGLLATVTDPNNQTTTYVYDALGRPTSVTYPDTGQTTKAYVDTAPQSVTTTVKITSSMNKTSTVLLDGVGRNYQSQLTSDPSGTDYTDTGYDALERVSTVSNPHRSTSSTTDGTTTHIYDELGRECVLIPPDGTVVSSCPTTAPVGDVFTTYAGNCTTVTDEAGITRKTCVDGLGRMTGVWENPTVLNYETDYAYDGFSNLISVMQKGGASSGSWRTRSFTYDALQRLTSANNPESGTINYSYVLAHNALCAGDSSAVCTKTAPLPNQTGSSSVTTTYTYDALNRLTSKSYNDAYTAKVQYAYDGGILTGCHTAPPGDTDNYPIGRRTSMCDASGATNWTHDTMGRILQDRRTIGTVVGKYDNDAYNLDGSISGITLPVGYSVAYTYNKAAEPVTVKVYGTYAFNYVNSATYSPNGALTSASLGTTPITVTNAYNDRLQPLLLSATTPSATLFGECFDFHLGVAINTPPCSFSASTQGNNGNVYTIVNNRASTRTQSFTYDALNRIKTGQSSGSQWGETYTIDAWGNLTNEAGISGKTYSEGLNTSAFANNQLSGFGYDAAGNLSSNLSLTYVYDAENRLIAAGGMSYIYDGDGNRVEKCTEGSTPGTCASGATGTLYWWGTGTAPQAETDLSGNVLEDYIFLGGQRIARRDVATNTVHFYFSDQVGSHGVITSATGSVCEQDIDYYPYGGVENDYCGNSGITQPFKFNGKERDSESGLDMFGARYYGSNLTRFMTPDWAAKPTAVPYASFGNPQSLNLYSYVNNNPTTTRDPDGHCCADEIDFGEGVLRGIASSVSFGYFGAPRSSDSTASIAGQLTGTGIVGTTGEFARDAGAGMAGVGLVAEGPSLGTSTVVLGVGAAGVLGGATMEAGAAANVARIVSAPLQSSETGSYTNTHASGKTYSGKGSKERSQTSAKRVETQTGDAHVATDWKSSPNEREAFKDESHRIDANGGAQSDSNYNKIDSPGKKYREQDGPK